MAGAAPIIPGARVPPPIPAHVAAKAAELPKKIRSPDEIVTTPRNVAPAKPHIPGRGHEDGLKDKILLAWESLMSVFPEFKKGWFWAMVLIVLSAAGIGAWKTIEYHQYRNSPQWALDELRKMGIPFSPQNFMRAVERDDRRAVELFFKAGVDANEVVSGGRTPLMIMAERGDYAKTRLLLENGVDIHFENERGESALSVALEKRHIPIFRLLRHAGARNLVNIFSLVKFADNQSIEEIINERFAAQDIPGSKRDQFEEIDGKYRYRLNLYDAEGATPLIWAVLRGDVKTVELLLNNRADVNAADVKEGQTPLMIAASNGMDPVMVPLLRHNANVNVRDKKGRTALFISVVQNRPSAVGILLAAGADPNLGERSQGLSVVSAAAFLNNPPVVAALVDAGADVMQPDYRGLSAMDHAAANGSVESIEILIKKAGKAYLGREQNILTAIKIAEKQGHTKVVELLKPLTQ